MALVLPFADTVTVSCEETAAAAEAVSWAWATVVVILLLSEGVAADAHPVIDSAAADTIAARSTGKTFNRLVIILFIMISFSARLVFKNHKKQYIIRIY